MSQQAEERNGRFPSTCRVKGSFSASTHVDESHAEGEGLITRGSPILRGDIMVEYGPVKIGGETYTCPVRAVSMAVDASGLMWGLGPYNLFNELPHPPVALLNDTTFSGYHLFRSNSRILKGAPEPEH